jgi:hypothetical protein
MFVCSGSADRPQHGDHCPGLPAGGGLPRVAYNSGSLFLKEADTLILAGSRNWRLTDSVWRVSAVARFSVRWARCRALPR